ncbi:hypothetical protein NQ117_08665 [Paenibacillus sp. SC116]|uniref:hypothetical protein n=1 Tax=Paenibacillus sp. SC116 TaxID=2968986 RepID=UPI00215AE16F|nr:hypothetical protein [Paenibacillus sp. SC116]MCR8843758.1 hypothetical protein [Paenibacillus sp. SC116]
MDTECGVEEKICELLIELNGSLREKSFDETVHLSPINNLLKTISSEKVTFISRKLLKNFDNTYSWMISEMDYFKQNKKGELRSGIKSIEKIILDFLNVTLSADEYEFEFLVKLGAARENKDDKINMLNILNEVFQYASEKQGISKKLAYTLFSIEFELVNESGYLTEPFRGWDEMIERENVAFENYLSFDEVIREIFGHGVRL